MPFWLKDGKVVVNSSGSPILCDTCPCDEDIPLKDCFWCDDGLTSGGHGPTEAAAECFEITIAGVTNGTCTAGNCDQFNGTYVLIRAPGQPADLCSWFADETRVDCEGFPTGGTRYSLSPQPQPSGPISYWELAAIRDGGIGVARWRFTPPEDFNCLEGATFSLTSSTTHCSGWPSTVTVEAAACP